MFKNEKTTQAVAYLLNRSGGRMPYLALMKLLYFADKKALLTSGLPMTFDNWVSLDHGPVLSNTLNLIKGRHNASSYWNQYLRTDGFDLCLMADPGDDLLSEFDEEVIDSVLDEYKGRDKWQLRDLSHELPEWQDPDGSSIPIRYDEVLRNEGLAKEDVLRVQEDIDFARFIAATSEPLALTSE